MAAYTIALRREGKDIFNEVVYMKGLRAAKVSAARTAFQLNIDVYISDIAGNLLTKRVEGKWSDLINE